MPTPAEFVATVQTALGVVIFDGGSGPSHARMGTDFDALHEPVPSGEVRYQIQSFTLPQTTLPDSEANYRPAVLVVLKVHYKLSDPLAEAAEWTQALMQSVLQTLTTPQWWFDLSGVHYIDKAPEGSDVARVGDVVSFTVTATVTIDPP